MKIMNVKSLILIVLIFGIGGLTSVNSQQFQAELDFQLGTPQGDFKDQIDNKLGYGLGGRFGYRFGDSPFVLGLDLGFMNFGTESREEPLSSTIPDLRVNIENSYNLFHGHLLVRVIPAQMIVKPYLEGLFGFNHFSTETVLRQRGGIGGGEEILRDTNFKDTALSYGLGAGVQFNVYHGYGIKGEEELNFPYSIGINIMSRYLMGHEAEYLKRGSIIRENGNVRYDVIKSTTDLLYFQIGLVMTF